MALFLVSAAACPSSPAASNTPASKTADDPGVAAGGEREPLKVDEPTLLVGHDSGLAEYDLDGALVRVHTETAAIRPRVLPDGTVLFLHRHQGDYALVELSTDGSERVVAAVPTGFDHDSCESIAEESDYLSVHSDWGFRVDVEAGVACIDIADRNDNMADLQVSARIDLNTGAVDSGVAMDMTEACPETAVACEGEVSRRDARPEPSATFAWSWDADGARLYPTEPRDGAEAIHVCLPDTDMADETAREFDCASEESRSRSGRFVLVSGLLSEGDYIHRQLYIVDLATGELLRLEPESDQFATIAAEEVMTDDYTGLDVVGESDIRWVGDGVRDRLWVDGRLLDPAGRRVTEIGGDLAARL